ncbi:MAG TPA: hypothetical protein VJ994_02680 [Paracoccaceae bacterium]|nr:hypothetical protein [Paracoccaceae bacterium]
MGGLANILEILGSHPLAKWLAVAFALRAGWTLLVWRRCSALRAAEVGAAETLEAIERRRQAPWRHSMRFLVVMVGGLALAVVGLFSLAKAEAPVGLIMLFAGMYLFLTEPVRHQIVDAEDRLAAAAQTGDGEATALARSMLNGNHVNLVLIDVCAALGLGAAVLALSGGIAPGL